MFVIQPVRPLSSDAAPSRAVGRSNQGDIRGSAHRADRELEQFVARHGPFKRDPALPV